MGTTDQKSLPWRERTVRPQCHITVVNWLSAITTSNMPMSMLLRSFAKRQALAAAKAKPPLWNST